MTLSETLEEAFCVYKSTRFIRIRNRKLATIYYLCLLAVLLYIIVYTVYAENGYQAIDQVTGTSSAKLKGTGSTNTTSDGFVVYDAMDLVVPSVEENAFFATTSIIMTPNQTRSVCAGNSDVPSCSAANVTTACPINTYSDMSQGVFTGNCAANKHCEVRSWCPLEADGPKVPVANIGKFTAFIKVDVAFSAFDVSRSNTYDVNGDGSPSYGYNLFSLDDIIGNATNGAITNVSSDIVNHGAIILMESQWNCNLDKGENDCNPVWKFMRIDSEPGTMSFGFNYRSVDYNTDMSKRMLRKTYGVRVVFTTSGTGRKFSFAALTVTFGAGLAYLGAATILTDIVLEKFLPQSDAYVRLKNKFTDDNKISMRNVNADDQYHDLSVSTGMTNDHDPEAGLNGMDTSGNKR